MQILSGSFDMNFCHYVNRPNIQALFPSGKPFTVLPNRMSSPKQALNVEWMPPRVMDLRATQHQSVMHWCIQWWEGPNRTVPLAEP